jgi:hypothetical protein
MTTLTEPRQTETVGDGVPGIAELVVTTGRTIFEGAQVGITTAGLAIDSAAGTAVAYVGKALHTVVGDGALTIRYKPGVHVWENSLGDPVSAADIGNVVFGEDDETIAATAAGPLAPAGILVAFDANGPRVYQSVLLAGMMVTAGTSAAALTIALAAVTGASLVGSNAAGYIAATVVAQLAEVKAIADAAAIEADLFSDAPGSGLSTVGFDDVGNFTAAADPEAAIQEIYQHLLSSKVPLRCSLYDFREVSAAGDVGAIAANGGILASDTTPILRGDAAETQEIYWAAANSDPIACQFTLGDDFDDTRDVTVNLWVYSDNTNTDPANFTVESGWNGGALVVDAAVDAAPSGVHHKLAVTIANADIPAGAQRLTLILTPPAHAADGIGLVGHRIDCGAKLLTS